MLRRNRAKQQPIHEDYIIARHQHRISKTDISPNALKVLNRLSSAGYQAYLVGGSVRDLLLHKRPKDFDVATNATPNQIRALFRNGRIIGRRFKLVHVLFHREIIEVATFRGDAKMEESAAVSESGMLIRDNVFGTLEEDAWRRDFTINSLFYNIDDSSIVDFTGGVADVKAESIRIIGDAKTRYQEDPVRMLRAIRFSAKLHFTIAKETGDPISEMASNILLVAGSRLFEEMGKIYQCGHADRAQQLLVDYGLFQPLFSQTAALYEDSRYPCKALLGIALENTDRRMQENKTVNPAFLFAVLLWFPLLEKAAELQAQGIPPLPAMDQAMSIVVAEQNKTVAIPKRFSLVMREIWLLQFRFQKRTGKRAYLSLEHPRFRAAYDFLAIRALAGDESMELADWWTRFQDATELQQAEMVESLPAEASKKRSRKRRS